MKNLNKVSMYKIFSVILFTASTVSLFSQNINHSHLDHSNMRVGEEIEYCTTHKKISKVLSDLNILQQFSAAQNQLLLHEEDMILNQNLNKTGTIYKVPVVFHVLHNGGIENISRAQILDAIEILNVDFRKQNSDVNNVINAFQGMQSDIEIEFVLATKAPDGQCFSGITRTQSPLTVEPQTPGGHGGEDQIDAVVAGNDVYQGQWPANKYLNIFICKEIGGAAGYTFNPGLGNSMFVNSIFLLHNYVGSIGTGLPQLSRALTHEVGHWLNLSHPWGPNNNPGNLSSCNDDDGVNDTPNTIGVTSCNLSESSCGVLANVENFMDYSYCSKMFTSGQRSRMRAAITSSISGRNNLWTTANLNATGANNIDEICKAEFSSNNRVVCVGTDIDFTDESFQSPTSWNWTFQGGSPSSSSVQNPSVTYNTPGVYEVTLTASNQSGTVSQTKTNFIRVLNENGVTAIQESFETTSSIPSNKWFNESFHNGTSWELSSDAANTGTKSIMIKNAQNIDGSIDELMSTTIYLDLNLSASLTFKYAFAKKENSNNDKLVVKVSNDCGQTWATKKSISGSSLVTAPNTTGNFIPDETQWKTATISSNSLSNFLVSDFRMKFIFTSGGGNNIYIDDINIDGPVSLIENSIVEKFIIYPNPAENEVKLSLKNNNVVEDFNIKIYDVVGKVIDKVYSGTLAIGEHQYNINTSDYNSGVYFINLNNGVQNKIEKLIIK